MLLLGDIVVNKNNVLNATTRMIAKAIEAKEAQIMTATKTAMTRSAMTATKIAMTASSQKLEAAGSLPEPFYLLHILGLKELYFGEMKDIL
jgi:hypothetical protein